VATRLTWQFATRPGISITKARQVLQQTDQILKTIPEVDHVFGKVGRVETASDPATLNRIETSIELKPESEWRPGMTHEKLVQSRRTFPMSPACPPWTARNWSGTSKSSSRKSILKDAAVCR